MIRVEDIRARLDYSADEKEWYMQREAFPMWSVKTTSTNKIVAEHMFGSIAEFIANAPQDIDYLIAALKVAEKELVELAKLRKVVVTDDMQGMALGAIYEMVSRRAEKVLAQLRRGEFGEESE